MSRESLEIQIGRAYADGEAYEVDRVDAEEPTGNVPKIAFLLLDQQVSNDKAANDDEDPHRVRGSDIERKKQRTLRVDAGVKRNMREDDRPCEPGAQTIYAAKMLHCCRANLSGDKICRYGAKLPAA